MSTFSIQSWPTHTPIPSTHHSHSCILVCLSVCFLPDRDPLIWMQRTLKASGPRSQPKGVTLATTALAPVTTQLTVLAPLMEPAASVLPLVTCPNKFTGEPSQCQGFLLQCHLYFPVLKGISDQAKIAHFLGMLTCNALRWATIMWAMKGGKPLSSYDCFTTLFHRVFDHTLEGKEVSEQLLAVKQGRWGVAEYALEFCMLAVESSWNESALKAGCTFCQGLNLTRQLGEHVGDDKVTLNSITDLAILPCTPCHDSWSAGADANQLCLPELRHMREKMGEALLLRWA